MRVGIYDPYFDDLGGGEKYMMTIASFLSRKHDVSVFWDNEQEFFELKKRFSLDLDKVTLRPNIFSSKVSFLDKNIETNKYDVLIILCDGSIPFVFSKKVFLHIQQPLQHLESLSWKEKIKLLRVSGIFYNSEFTKSFNKKLFTGTKSTVIYPPVALQAKEVTKENVILHVGRFRPQDALTGIKDFKKQTVMIDAFKEMIDAKQINNWKFVMAVSVREHDKEKFNMLRESAKDYPIEFFINKTNDELWTLYNKAKIYWHASGFGEDLDKHPEYAEHFGITTVEAMGAGVVPVVINAGGQKEIVTDKKDGLMWNTLSELKEKTVILSKDKKLWGELSDAARIRAKDFGIEKFYTSIETLIEQ